MNEDEDVVSIGKLRRPRKLGAAVSYDPGYGIRVDGEDAPPDAASAAAWCRRAGGWLRVYEAAKRSTSPIVADFIRLCRQ